MNVLHVMTPNRITATFFVSFTLCLKVAMPAAELKQVQAHLAQMMETYALTPEDLSARFPVLTDQEVDGQRIMTVQGPSHRVVVRYRGTARVWVVSALEATSEAERTGWQIGCTTTGKPAWTCTLADGTIDGYYYQQRPTGTPELLMHSVAGLVTRRQVWDAAGTLVADEVLDPPIPWTYAPIVPEAPAHLEDESPLAP